MSLQYFKSDAVLEDVLRAIKEDGGAILVDAAPENNLDNFVSELEPYLATTPYGRDDFTGHKTRRTGALLARMPSSHNFELADRVLLSHIHI